MRRGVGIRLRHVEKLTTFTSFRCLTKDLGHLPSMSMPHAGHHLPHTG